MKPTRLFKSCDLIIKTLREKGTVHLRMDSNSESNPISLSPMGRTLLTTLAANGNDSYPYSLLNKQFSLKDFNSSVFKELIHSLGDQSHSDNILSAILMRQTILSPKSYSPTDQDVSIKTLQGECSSQLTSLLHNKRDYDVPAKNEHELFNQLLALSCLFSEPTNACSNLGIGSSSRTYLPSFHSGARFLAIALIKYFELTVACGENKSSCCVKVDGRYTCNQCCLYHSKKCKNVFSELKIEKLK